MRASDFFTDAYFDSFRTPKYRFRGPLHRRLIRRLMGRIAEQLRDLNPASIVDAGAGEGFFTAYLVHRFPDSRITAVDLLQDDLDRLKERLPNVETIVGDVQAIDLGLRFDVLVATEILEHLPDPRAALQQFAAHAERMVVTVPWEPFFMLGNLARGKNLKRFGNDIEHVNHWSPASFRRFLEQGIAVDAVRGSFPWIVASGHPRT